MFAKRGKCCAIALVYIVPALLSFLQLSAIGMAQSAGYISTVAGNGTSGFSGDGGPATSAQINGAQGIAVDPAGNLYIADSGNHRIRKVLPMA